MNYKEAIDILENIGLKCYEFGKYFWDHTKGKFIVNLLNSTDQELDSLIEEVKQAIRSQIDP